ncbi:signal recognition particle-docking protein FtsY [Catenulispora yoronensis]|uniref:Signal recognition particle receptor FtsY n=1 Tax=Catenulispora yoronensis TaxID=450799 RepID=A0ABP5GT12_9ACTN
MEFLVIGIIIAAIALVGAAALLYRARGRRRPVEQPPRTPVAPPKAQDSPAAGSGTATAERAPPAGAPAEVPTAAPARGGTEPQVAEIEVPEPTAGRLVRLRSRLSRSQNALGQGLLMLLSRDKLDEATWEEIEDTLIAADLGVGPAGDLVEKLRTRTRVQGTRTVDEARTLLREELIALIDPALDRTLKVGKHPAADGQPARPAVAMVVGVNGTGKTTTTGKLARVLIADGYTVVLGAADTFRAAAADQLQTWGARVGAYTVRGAEGADPASVAFEAVKEGTAMGVDTVLIDTAGRLHTKTGLMDELGKVKRVAEKQATVDEVLLVLDATTGQNGLVQARVFAEVVNITGIVLTKLDGTAKGGIVVAVQQELGVPVKLVGLGEGADDLAPFDPEAFVDALLQ